MYHIIPQQVVRSQDYGHFGGGGAWKGLAGLPEGGTCCFSFQVLAEE